MRRRFWLSRRSSAERTGVGEASDVLRWLRQRLVRTDVYLASRGFVSTDSRGHRRLVGTVQNVEPNQTDAGHWVVEVETTEAYEARQYESIGGVVTGRQDLDAVEEARQRRRAAVGYSTAAFQNEILTRAAPNQLLQPRQLVYATSGGTVAATAAPYSPGTFVRMDGDRAVVALHGGNVELSQPQTPVQDVTAAIQVSPAISRMRATINAGRSLYSGVRDMVMQISEVATAREDSIRQFTSILYTDRTDVAEARGTSRRPQDYTITGYSADQPATAASDFYAQIAASSPRRQLAELRQQQDRQVAGILATSQPVHFPVDNPDADDHTRNICALVDRVGREATQGYLGAPLRTDPRTGYIHESERRRIEDRVTAALRQRLDGDIRFVVDRDMSRGLQGHFVGEVRGERGRVENLFPIVDTATGATLSTTAQHFYGFDREANETDAELRNRIGSRTLQGHQATQVWIDDLFDDTPPLPRPWRVDAVEALPPHSAWLPRLLPWLSGEVMDGDEAYEVLVGEVVAAGLRLSYDASTKTLSVGGSDVG